jgi:hypothetical protein
MPGFTSLNGMTSGGKAVAGVSARVTAAHASSIKTTHRKHFWPRFTFNRKDGQLTI